MGATGRPLAITKWYFLLTTGIDSRRIILAGRIVCYTAVFSVVTQRSSVTTIKTAV